MLRPIRLSLAESSRTLLALRLFLAESSRGLLAIHLSVAESSRAILAIRLSVAETSRALAPLRLSRGQWEALSLVALAALLAVPATAIAAARGFDGLYGQDAYAYFDYATTS